MMVTRVTPPYLQLMDKINTGLRNSWKAAIKAIDPTIITEKRIVLKKLDPTDVRFLEMGVAAVDTTTQVDITLNHYKSNNKEDPENFTLQLLQELKIGGNTITAEQVASNFEEYNPEHIKALLGSPGVTLEKA